MLMQTIACRTIEELSSRAARILVDTLRRIIAHKGKAILAIPGGRSVAGLLQKLSPQDLDWSKVEIFMIDERIVPLNDKESNYKQAQDLFLNRVNTKAHPFLLEKGVEQYNREFLRTGSHFDIILLGVGADGHIAALFPGHPALEVRGRKYIQIADSPKPPKERVTASPDMIKDADTIILLFAGREKKKAYEQFSNPGITATECPAKIALEAKKLSLLKDF